MWWRYLHFILMAPGIIIHELSHAIFCLLFGVKIYKINLLQYKRVAGYVMHAEPTRFLPSFFISFGPLIINSVLAIWFFSQVEFFQEWTTWLFLWLGIVLGLQAIPSTGDAKALFKSANHNWRRNPLVILFYPLVLVLYFLNFLKYLFIDFIFVAFLFYLAQVYVRTWLGN